MNSPARSSSSSGCVGGSLRRPKSLGVVTSPLPKCHCQTRLTSTRAVSGLRASAIAWASSSRPLPFRKGARSGPPTTGGTAAGPPGPAGPGCPRRKTCGSTGLGASLSTIARAGAAGCGRVELLDGAVQLRRAGCAGVWSRNNRDPFGPRSPAGRRGRRAPAGATPIPARPGSLPPPRFCALVLQACLELRRRATRTESTTSLMLAGGLRQHGLGHQRMHRCGLWRLSRRPA